MKRLIIIPTEREQETFLGSLKRDSFEVSPGKIGRMNVAQIPALNTTVATGGMGKAQFAVHTQYLLDSSSGWDVVVCAGVAGALAHELKIGDVVVGTETVEHDFKTFRDDARPRFAAGESAINALKQLAQQNFDFDIRFAPVTSGDQTVTTAADAQSLMQSIGAVAVGWEGAGGARAAVFSGVPFVEIRAITDYADGDVPADIRKNLPICMANIAKLVAAWASEG